MSFERAAEVRQALRAIVADPDYSVAALSGTRMTNLLNDLLPDAPREKSVLAGAAEARVAEILLDRTGHGMDPRLAVSQASAALAAATVFPREVCDWVTGEIALALGLIGPADVALPSAPGPGRLPGQGQGQRAGRLADETTVGRNGQRDQPTILPAGPQVVAPGPPVPPGPPGQRTGLAARWRGLDPRRRTGLTALGAVATAAVATLVAVAVWPSPSPPPVRHHHSPSPSPTPPSPSPTPTVKTLATIMNPAGQDPIATKCVTGPLQGLDPATLTGRLYCTHATTSHVVVWAYQFDSFADYQSGVTTLNSRLKFTPSTAGKGCPPPSGHTSGLTRWHAGTEYPLRSGQNLECYTATHGPVLIWTLPPQNVVFLAEYEVAGTTISTLMRWWSSTHYG